MITVKLVFIARFREQFGEGLSLDVPSGVSISRLIDILASQENIDTLPLKNEKNLFAVNHKIAKPDQTLNDGDELAMMPPVTGG